MEGANGNSAQADSTIESDNTIDVASQGLESRTQSYTSVASSQFSRSSRLPDYDFGEDDNPKKYKGKKDSKVKKDKKNEKDKKKGEKNTKKDKAGKSTEKTKKKKSKNPENSDKPHKKKKKTDKKQENTDEAEKIRENSDDETNSVDNQSITQSETSREPSVTSRKRKKKRKSSKNGLNLFPDKNAKSRTKKSQKKKRKMSESDVSNMASFTDVTSEAVSSDDEEKRTKKKSKKPKKSRDNKEDSKNNSVVVVVTDDDDVSSVGDVMPKKKLCMGICPVPSKKEPLVYNCCMCCSLGAGTLISGIIFALFCIGYLVIRAEEFRTRTVIGIWNGVHLLPDVWRVFLIVGFITASICLLASVLLVVASCLWGSKEQYKRIRRVITFWFIGSIPALINNIGEAVFIQAMPNIKLQGFYHESDKIEDIKSNNVRLWALTGLFTIFFIYITLVLISYLRMLKYMDSPKIGTAQKPVGKSAEPNKKEESQNKKKTSEIPRTSSRVTETRVKTISEIPKRAEETPVPKIPRRQSLPARRRPPEDEQDRIYMNTGLQKTANKTSENDKRDSFKDVVEQLANDPNVFENISKPRPLKRMPVRKIPPPGAKEEAIYVNHNPRPVTPSAQYSRVVKPLKRASSFSNVSTPVYDFPPRETELEDLLKKENRNETQESASGDTGFNSRSSVASSFDGHHPDIAQMEKLAEELRRKQEALDKSGNCDPATAENLTQMAINALKLSEKILQDVKSNENNRQTPASLNEEDRPPIQQNTKLAEQFFDELSRDPNAMTTNPIEELFRMYGRDLCSQNPEMVNRYLMSYKALQDSKFKRQPGLPVDTGLMDIAMSEQRPWTSILNPSEAVPAAMQRTNSGFMGPMGNPLQSSISQSTAMSSYPGEDPRMGHMNFSNNQFIPPPPVAQPFHSLSHAQSGPPPPNSFFPIDYPLQNSASYNSEPPPFSGDPQNNHMISMRGQSRPEKPTKWSNPPHNAMHHRMMPPYKRKPVDYYDDECPYSCCYSSYGDYGPTYGEYGYDDSLYGEGLYTGSNWFPMGDPAYSLDPYHNPYEVWNEPAPPYTEESSTNVSRQRPISRGHDARTESKGYSGRLSSRPSGSRGFSHKSKSLPNLLDEDLYSERTLSRSRSSRSTQNLEHYEDDEPRNAADRTLSRSSSKSRPISRESNATDITTTDAFMKGYKAALKEALKTISSSRKHKEPPAVYSEDDLLEKLISKVTDRDTSPENLHSRRESKMTRTVSSESRFSNGSRRSNKEDWNISDRPGRESRNVSRTGLDRKNSNRGGSRSAEPPEKLPPSISRRTSKLSFRPSSRPGQPMFDDYYDDYRSTSSVPPASNDFDEPDFLRRKSSHNSSGFRGVKSGGSRTSGVDDSETAFDMASSHGGRPNTRSGRTSYRENGDSRFEDETTDASYPFSESERHFYNKLNLERPRTTSPAQDERTGRDRRAMKEHFEGPRSHSSAGRRGRNDMREPARERRSASETRKNGKGVLWYMGDNESEPIYSEYEGVWTGDSMYPEKSHPRPLERSSSFPDQPRLDSTTSSKRKSVTFDKRPKIKEVSYRRTSWN